MSEMIFYPVLGTEEVFKPIKESDLLIKKIDFIETIPNLDEVKNKWDVSFERDGSIIAWLDNDTLKISGNGTILANEDSDYLFSDFKDVENISFNPVFRTYEMCRAEGMFKGCENLKRLDLSNWEFDSLWEVENMFSGCTKLNSLFALNLEIIDEFDKLMNEKMEEVLREHPLYSTEGEGFDSECIVKFQNPLGAGTWLIVEGEYQPETNDWLMFGFCHIFEWEWGYVTSSELESVQLPFGLKIQKEVGSLGSVKDLAKQYGYKSYEEWDESNEGNEITEEQQDDSYSL